MAIMRCIASALGAASVLVTATPLDAQQNLVCGVYQAVLDSLLPDTTHTLVVYDSTSLATPQFAFHGWVGLGLPKAGSDVPLTDSLWQSMRAAHRDRDALPECIGIGRPVVRVPYDSLRAPFADRDNGWQRFVQVFPGSRGFYILGHPLFLGSARTEALVYVGEAAHWLGGSGTIYYLRYDGDRWQVHGRHGLWAS